MDTKRLLTVAKIALVAAKTALVAAKTALVDAEKEWKNVKEESEKAYYFWKVKSAQKDVESAQREVDFYSKKLFDLDSDHQVLELCYRHTFTLTLDTYTHIHAGCLRLQPSRTIFIFFCIQRDYSASISFRITAREP